MQCHGILGGASGKLERIAPGVARCDGVEPGHCGSFNLIVKVYCTSSGLPPSVAGL